MRYQENETNAITGEIPSGCHDVTFVLDDIRQLPDSLRFEDLINSIKSFLGDILWANVNFGDDEYHWTLQDKVETNMLLIHPGEPILDSKMIML